MNRQNKLRRKKLKHFTVKESNNPKCRQTRYVKSHKVIVRDDDGSLCEIKPTDTIWYLRYVAHPPLTQRLIKPLRFRIRIPYDSFLSMSDVIDSYPIFSRWTRCDDVGSDPSNIKLLLLGSFRCMGRVWTLDDVYEAKFISVDTNRDFLKYL